MRATGVFGEKAMTKPASPTVDVLRAAIEQPRLENDFFAGALGKAGLLGGKNDRPPR